MDDIQKYIASGILERYVTGDLDPSERREVEQMANTHPEIREVLDQSQQVLEQVALSLQKPTPKRARKNFFDFLDSQLEEETIDPGAPKVLHTSSRADDYQFWLDQPEMVPPPEYDNIFFIPVADNEDGLSAIVWMKLNAEEEIHTDCIEKFLIIEGSCDITVEGKVHQLQTGDFISIPLHQSHNVQVTSEIPCKIFLQRISA